jgi:tungstate transport system permease protein
VQFLWAQFRAAVPLIFNTNHYDINGNPYLGSTLWFTVQVALVATAIATVIGLPIGLAIGLGRFRGRGVLQVLANASLGIPPVIVGLVLLLIITPRGPLGSLHLILTKRAIFVAQAVLALPYIVALTAAAVQGLPSGLLAQARALGASRLQLWRLATREARIGVMAAIIAALGSALAEVGAIVLVGGNVYGFDQTLASAILYDANSSHYTDAIAVAIVLVGLILLLMGVASVLQQRGGGVRMRFRPSK